MGAACGAFFRQKDQPAKHAGWVLHTRVGWEIIGGRFRDAAHLETSVQTTSHKLNVYSVRIKDTRRAACVGFALRSFVLFCAQRPHSEIRPTQGVAEMAAPWASHDEAQPSNGQMADERERRRG